jgi:hypothetical protein
LLRQIETVDQDEIFDYIAPLTNYSYLIFKTLINLPIICVRMGLSDLVYNNVFHRDLNLSYLDNIVEDLQKAVVIHVTTSDFDIIHQRRKIRRDFINEEQNFMIYHEYYSLFEKLREQGMDCLTVNNDGDNLPEVMKQIEDFYWARMDTI